VEHSSIDSGVKNKIRELAISVAYIAPSNVPSMPDALQKLLLISISALYPNAEKIDENWLAP
jgi:hypothetical protein